MSRKGSNQAQLKQITSLSACQLNNWMERKESAERVSPVDRALLFGHHGLKVGELEEAVMEVVKVKNTHQQEGGGNENPGEEHFQAELLQAQVVQAAGVGEGRRSMKEMDESLC